MNLEVTNMSEGRTGIFSNLRGDLFGGITAGVVALPLALAFGEQTELGAVAGLYGAIALGIVAALLGGTKTQISGPTAPMTVVSAAMITEVTARAGSLQEAMPIIVAVFVMTGVIQALLGVLRLGRYIKYIPYPVVSGFMSGIGVIIIVTQIFPFIGAGAPEGGAFGTLRKIHIIPEVANLWSVGAALLTVAIIYFMPRLTKKFPATLAALIVVSVAAYFVVPEGAMLRINSAGPVPTGLPEVHLNFFGVLADPKVLVRILEYAGTLAALGAIDSLLTSVVADNITKTKHNSNRELIGQGLGNMAAGLIGGLPGAGATMRTVINIKSGGRTRLSGVVAGLLLAAILLGLGALVGYIPNAVLAGILVTVGIGIIDYKGLRHLRSIPRSDAVIMFIVLLLTVFVDLLVAVGVGMILAAFVFMKKAADMVEGGSSVRSLEEFKHTSSWEDEKGLVGKLGKKVWVKEINGPLFFGAIEAFLEQVKHIPPETEVVIIRLDRVPYIDQSGLYAMEEAIMELEAHKNLTVILTGVKGQVRDMFEKIGIIPNLVRYDECFDSREEVEAYLQKKFKHLLEDGKEAVK